MSRPKLLFLLLIASSVLAIGSWAVTSWRIRTTDIVSSARTGHIERFVDNPGKLHFEAPDRDEPETLPAYYWSHDDMENEWQRRVDGDTVTLRSPRLDFDRFQQIDSIAIQVDEVTELTRFALLWSEAATLSGSALSRNRREVTVLDEGPPNTFVIRGTNIPDLDFRDAGDTARPRYFFLRFPLDEGGRLRFRSVGILSGAARLASTAYGQTRRSVQGEFRDTLYARTPGTITYRTTLSANADLLFGVHSLDPGAAVTYTVVLEGFDGRSAVMFQETLTDGGVWEDFRVDLSQDREGEHVVTLSAESDRTGNTVFWANPMIRSRSDRDTKPNVILYVVDALRADHLGLYGYPKQTSPFLDELGKKGLVFEHGYAASTWTKPSVTTLVTSLYPQTHGVGQRSFTDVLPDSVDTLQDYLRLNGYMTASFSANPFSSTLSNLDQGFDYTFSIDSFAVPNRDAEQNKIHSDALNDTILPWIQAHADDRFYLYIHSVDPHRPFTPPGSPQHLRDGTGDIALYDSENYFNDQQIKRLYELLEEQGIARDTLLIITADHGESLGEHGQSGHGSSVYQEQSHVPLIMVQPGSLPPGISDRPVQLVDLMPTILEYCDVPFDRATLQGVNVLGDYDEPGTERAVFLTKFTYPDHMEDPAFNQSETYGVVQANWKLIAHHRADQAAPRLELYDLNTDKREAFDLSQVDRGRALKLHRDLVEFLAQQQRERQLFILEHRAGSFSVGTDKEITEGVWDRLRSLGYLRSRRFE